MYGKNIFLNLILVAMICNMDIRWRMSKPIHRSLSGKVEPTNFVQMTQFWKNWIPTGFLVMREVLKCYPFATLKYSVCLSQQWEGRMSGWIILFLDSLSMNPMAGNGLANLEESMWIQTEGMGILEGEAIWTTFMTEIVSLSDVTSLRANVVFHHKLLVRWIQTRHHLNLKVEMLFQDVGSDELLWLTCWVNPLQNVHIFYI